MGISTHILDTAKGKPAAKVSIILEMQSAAGEFIELGRGLTDNDGRQKSLLGDHALTAGVHRLTFDTGGYFAQTGERCFYPSVTVLFEIVDPAQHHHVPILLSAYGYSTYRGS
jgi:5-hydroxyisourate hydrolase